MRMTHGLELTRIYVKVTTMYPRLGYTRSIRLERNALNIFVNGRKKYSDTFFLLLLFFFTAHGMNRIMKANKRAVQHTFFADTPILKNVH